MWRQLQHGFRALGELVLPQACGACGRTLIDNERDWCLACSRRLLQATGVPSCGQCGRTVGPFEFTGEHCFQCAQESWTVTGLVRAGPYGSILGELVRKAKFGKRQELIRPLASILATRLEAADWTATLDGFVPVPTTLASRRQYGYEPVPLMARMIAKRLDRDCVPVLGIRGKPRPQVGLPASARIENVRGVFNVRKHADVEGATLCVIDDVATTGATMRECARVLRQAGAAAVYGAVIARAGQQAGDDHIT